MLTRDVTRALSAFACTALLVSPALAQERPGRPGGRQGVSPEQFVDRMMEGDADGDGKLSQDEMPERFARLFERVDADSDGFVTREELSAFAAERPGAGGRPGQGRPGEGDEARPEPSEEAFERFMGQAGRAVRGLRRSSMDDGSLEADLEATVALQSALMGAKVNASAVPMSRQAKEKFGDDTKAYQRSMRIALIKALREVLAMEEALLEGDGEKAQSHLAKAREIQGEAHGVFQEQW